MEDGEHQGAGESADSGRRSVWPFRLRCRDGGACGASIAAPESQVGTASNPGQAFAAACCVHGAGNIVGRRASRECRGMFGCAGVKLATVPRYHGNGRAPLQRRSARSASTLSSGLAWCCVHPRRAGRACALGCKMTRTACAPRSWIGVGCALPRWSLRVLRS